MYVLVAVILTVLVQTGLAATSALQRGKSTTPVRVLIVTGGHNFEEDAFFAMFDAMKSVTWTHARFGSGAEEKLNPEAGRAFDAVVFYDMYQKKERHRAGWLAMLAEGKGTVFLHHALGSYIDWEEYNQIVGGKAVFHKRMDGDVELPRTRFKPNISHVVHIADKSHPITKGLRDFSITDEVYSNYYVNSDVHVLLTSSHPDSGAWLGWTHQYKKSRVVCLTPGHDHLTYENPQYRKILERAILWASSKSMKN